MRVLALYVLVTLILFSSSGYAAENPETTSIRIYRNPTDGQNYVWIPAGQFVMGCALEDEECFVTEEPIHEVKITNGFWLGQTEVTNEAYRRFADVTGRNLSGNYSVPRQAATDMTWNDAGAYCHWADGRLPHEAEWEYAARAGTTTVRYGNIDEIAWYRGNSGRGMPVVGQKKPNAWGLYDMLGGVWEWMADDHAPYKDYGILTQKEYRAGDKVIRGGYWQSSAQDLRASFRLGWAPADHLKTIGFRCVLPADPSGSARSGNPLLR